MQPDENLLFLLDAAKQQSTSDNKTAKLIGATPQQLSDWRHGRKACQPEDQALLAAVAGFDPVQTLARATVEYWEGKPKGDRLMRVLGKALPATIAAIGSAGANAAVIFSSIPTTHSLLDWLAGIGGAMCIM